MQVLTLLISSVILHVEQDKSNTPGNLPGEFCTQMQQFRDYILQDFELLRTDSIIM